MRWQFKGATSSKRLIIQTFYRRYNLLIVYSARIIAQKSSYVIYLFVIIRVRRENRYAIKNNYDGHSTNIMILLYRKILTFQQL